MAHGFIGTLMVAHASVIFQITLKKKERQERVTFLPLIVLAVSNLMGPFGELAAHVSRTCFVVSYLSGYVLLIALVALVYNLRRIIVSAASAAKEDRFLPEGTGK